MDETKLVALFDAMDDYAAMSNRELVAACIKTTAANSLVVLEMMNRLDPGWADVMRLAPAAPPPSDDPGD